MKTRIPDDPERPVFVDTSGRRGRKLRRIGWIIGAICVGYAAVVAISLAGADSRAPWLMIPGEDDENTTPAVSADPSVRPSVPASPSGGPTGSAPFTGGGTPTASGTRPTASPDTSPTNTRRPASPRATSSATSVPTAPVSPSSGDTPSGGNPPDGPATPDPSVSASDPTGEGA
ncbi:hypothetical protein PV318_02895 [Streptomyces sp. ME02-6991-2B]|nr:hypothetical protein [Streptomyces sp. ME02-6991-2B]